MPRFVEHGRLTLKITQLIDGPYNCCPSQHIAYCMLMHNIANALPVFKRTKALEALNQASSYIIRPVLYTKQHALIDVAFGMHSARMAFEEIFNSKFDSLIGDFPQMARRDDDIPYNLIAQRYREIEEMQVKGMSLADMVEKYFKFYNYPLVKPGENNAYFDLASRRVVRL